MTIDHLSASAELEQNLITHKIDSQSFDLSFYQKQLASKDNHLIPLKEEEKLLQELSEFELGRFLLKNKGLNGFWTAYIILHAFQKENLHPLEYWMVHKAPVIKATRERYAIFKEQLQKYIKNDSIAASLPCGLMDDLLGLDLSTLHNVHFCGIDLDKESLRLAADNANKQGVTHVSFFQKDAWNLAKLAKSDLLVSNGLNIYEPDDNKVTALYKEFYKSLKNQGILITSFLTPPPTLSPESTWKNFDSADVLKQRVILSDIIQVKWQAFRSEVKTREQLEEAGFTIMDVIYDSQGMFPTIVARKLEVS